LHEILGSGGHETSLVSERGLVPDNRVTSTVDLLRAVTNGVTLSAVEHPEKWPPTRQFEVLDNTLELLGLEPARSHSASATAAT
jgi:hypothetical protein